MAFVPFQMPQPGTAGVNAGISDLSSALSQMARDSLERQRMAAENLRNAGQDKRQKQQDFQNALVQAQKFASSGDMESAHAILAPYGAQLQQRESAAPGEWAPKLNNDELDFASSVGNVMPTGQPQPQQPQAPQGPMAIEPPPRGPDGAEPSAPQAPAPAPVHPLVAMAQQAEAKKKADNARMVQILTGQFNGQKFTLDPEAQKQRQLADADAAMRDASGETGDQADIVRELYPSMRAAAIASGQPLDANETMKSMQTEGRNRRLESEAAARQAHQDAQMQQQMALGQMRDARSDENNRRMTAAILGAAATRSQPALKEGASARADLGQFDQEFRRWYDQSQVKPLVGADRSLKAALANIQSGNPLAEKDAQIQLAKYFRGNVPTDSEMHLLYSNLGGKLGNGLPSFMERMGRGGLTPVEKQYVLESAKLANDENTGRLQRLTGSAKETFGPGSGYENLGPNVNAKLRGLYKNLGIDNAEMPFPEDSGGGVTLGSGNPRVPKAAPAAPKPSAKDHLVNAAKLSSLPPQYQQAYQTAKALLDKNPNDQKAQEAMRRIQAAMGGGS